MRKMEVGGIYKPRKDLILDREGSAVCQSRISGQEQGCRCGARSQRNSLRTNVGNFSVEQEKAIRLGEES